MDILFGIDLDGCPPQDGWRGVGRLVCGPQGLLNALEVALGLPAGDGVSELERVLAYREAVSDFLESNPQAFFARSFAADSLSASRVLLRWRDELALAGWSLGNESTVHPNGSDVMPKRLVEIAGIEADAPEDAKFIAGRASQLDRILSSLEKGNRTGISQVVVIDPKNSFPTKWATLLEQLGATLDPLIPTEPVAREGTRLHALQSQILSGGDQSAKLETAGLVENVTIWSNFSEKTLARSAAQLWRDPAAGARRLVVAQSDARARLNESLRQLDLPVLAAREGSASGTLTQLLPLCLRLHWDSFDPQAWLEFFLHPVCPVAGSLRYSLARAIDQSPGRGNAQWQQAIERSLERAQDDPANKTRLERDLAAWIELPCYDRESEIPGEQVASTARQLATWLRGIGAAKKASLDPEALRWLSVAGMVESFGRAVGSLPRVSHQELDRLLASWLASVNESHQEAGELGSPLPVASPGQVLSTADHLYWWQPGEWASLRSTWTHDERDWLAANGVRLVTSQAILEAAETSGLRAILHASESLTLFATSGVSGAQVSPVVTRVIAELGKDVVKDVSDQIETSPLAVKPLPLPQRWWSLSSPELLVPRKKESYSSISKLIYSPYQWVLTYQARLESGSLFGFGVGDNPIRRGNLLHDLAERLFAPNLERGESSVDWKSFDEGALQQWIDSIWTGFLDERAAHYRLPGLESARNGLLHTARQSLWQLVRHFQEAGVIEVEVEKFIEEVEFVGGQLNGRIDLVARSSDGVAVVDLKLGGKSIRQAEVADNRHLQLAVYGHLLEVSEGADPCTAFYILSRGGALLTRSQAFFPGASPVPIDNPDDTSEWKGCWQEFEQVWRWRRAQLDAGRIEVTVSGTESDECPPLEHWAAPEGSDFYNDFSALTGWPRTA